jgi:hypothetical protein
MSQEYRTGVTGQSQELERAYGFVYARLLLLVCRLCIDLAAQFESLFIPITILLTVAAFDSVRAALDFDRRTNFEHFSPRSEFFLFSASLRKTRFCRLTTRTIYGRREWSATTRLFSEPRPPATDFDDDDRSVAGNDSACRRQRRGRGDESLNRNFGGRRAINVFASNFAGGSGFLFFV